MLKPVADGEKPRVYDAWITSSKSPIAMADSASAEFISAIRDLLPMIKVLDPALAALLASVEHGKKAGMEWMSLSSAFLNFRLRLVWRQNGAGTQCLAGFEYFVVERPLDVDAYRSRAARLRQEHRSLASATEWPKDCLAVWFQEDTRREFVAPSDIASIRTLVELLEVQKRSIEQARTLVSEFIVRHLKIEDLIGRA